MTRIPIASLLPGESPRTTGVEQPHVIRLMEVETPLPPILVDRSTLRVIDGMHRLLAALLKGQSTIEVEFFDGTAEDGFLRAVETNVVHGLPLSQADRRAAATRIIASHPHMSDRAIARTSGMGAKTVANIRRRSTDAGQQLDARVGRDGRVRPLSSDEGRRRAVEVLRERPEASLREVARLAGVSPATVSDVRRRLAAGEAPLTSRSSTAEADRAETERTGTGVARPPRPRTERRERPSPMDPAPLLEKLLRDPSLRHKQKGRHLLRLLQQNAITTSEWYELTAVVPSHCGELVVNLARQYAETWMGFAQELQERVLPDPAEAAGD